MTIMALVTAGVLFIFFVLLLVSIPKRTNKDQPKSNYEEW